MSNLEASEPSEPTQASQRLADLRMDYTRGELHRVDLGDDPLAEVERWLDQARTVHRHGEMDEPHAMSLATADGNGIPSVRTVLLKGIDERGLCWFTNYESRKGRELAENPNAAINFRWGALERQVVVCGPVEKLSDDENDAYFLSRPLGSRIGAVVSAQSSVIESREPMEAAAARLAQVDESEISRPQRWGGYRLVPLSVEFWQGRPSRLHDRIRFRRDTVSSPWASERLAP